MDRILGRNRAAFLFLLTLVVAVLDWAGWRMRRDGVGWGGIGYRTRRPHIRATHVFY